MEPIVVVVAAAAVAAVAAAIAGARLSARHDARRLIARSVPRRVAEAREGELVAITGTIVVDAPLRAPMSGRECAYFDLQIEEKASSTWATFAAEQRGAAFFVEDETGRAAVDGAHIDAIVVMDRHRRSGTSNDATGELERLLARFGKKSTGILGLGYTLRYTEGVLEPGERVKVIGRATWEHDPRGEGGYRSGGRRLRLVAADARQRVFATDDPELSR